MTEQTKSRKVKVFLKQSIWVDVDGQPKKMKKGQTVLLSSADIKHFGKAVTKDLPEGEDE